MASHQHRRLCWNNDGSDMLSAAYGGGTWPVPYKSEEHFINSLMKFVEGSGVNAIFYCGHTNEPVWELVQHNPTVAKSLAALGADPDKAVVDFAHRNGMEYFYSIRMNDVHASHYTPKLSFWPPFRRAHPELLMGYVNDADWKTRFQPYIDRFLKIDERPKVDGEDTVAREVELRIHSEASHPLRDVFDRVGARSRDFWTWASYDYAKPAARQRYLEVVDEACRRYDLDGIELDWCRMAMFFRQGEERKNIPVMNDFIHQVHQCLEHHAQKRGRPILLAMRTPDSIQKSLDAGLDVETWARSGWINLIMAGTGMMPFSIPITEWVGLGRRCGVAVYGTMDRLQTLFRTGRPKWDNRDPKTDLDGPNAYDAASAAAARMWDAGVDGIYLYNWHTHHGPTDPSDFGKLPPIANPEKLARANKLYQVDWGWAHNCAVALATLEGQLPCRISTASGPGTVRLTFEIVDDPRQLAGAEMQVQWQEGVDTSRFSIALNENPLGTFAPIAPENVFTGRFEVRRPELNRVERVGWSRCSVDPRALRQGVNELDATLQPPADGQPADQPELLRVRLSVTYPED